jgi:quaternary ammonium compound-resistance protein SugE
MAWFYLLLAGVFEMAWPIGFKYTNGFRAHYPVVALTMGMMCLSFWLMSMAVNRGLHVGTAYAVWTAMGAAGTAVFGIILYKEPSDPIRLACLGLVIVGAVGLKFLAPPQQAPSAPASAASAPASDTTTT